MGKELLLKAYGGCCTETVPWVPYAGVHCGYLIGEKADVFLQDPELLAKGILYTAERYQADGIPLLFDLSLEAASLGCSIKWHPDNPPAVVSHPLECQSLQDAALKIPDANSGRWPVVVEAGKKIVAEKGDRALLGLCCGPLTLATHLRGVSLFTDLVKNKALARGILEFCSEACRASAAIYRQIGCEVIAIVDPVASQVHPQTFREFVTPYCRQAIEFIHSAGITSSFLTCGDATKVLEDICKMGVHSFSCDEQVNLTYARDLALKYGLAFSGSLKLTMSLTLGIIDPREDALVSLSAGGSTGFILAPGCNMPYNVPPENVDRVLEAIKWHKKYYTSYPLPAL